MLFNAEAQRTQREAQRTQERPRRRAGEWPVPRVVTREPRILFLPQFLFRLLCAYLCVLCVSALNTHSDRNPAESRGMARPTGCHARAANPLPPPVSFSSSLRLSLRSLRLCVEYAFRFGYGVAPQRCAQ